MPTFEQVSKNMFEKYNIHFVNWDDNRGGEPVNCKYIVSKHYFGKEFGPYFWKLSLDDMCQCIYDVVRTSRYHHYKGTLVGESCHLSDKWGSGDGFCFILGNYSNIGVTYEE